ncbi:MAG: aconitate hydratase, partial [Bacteroidales bacterium]
DISSFRKGEDYINLKADRVAMQDATAQMALLQFMVTGKDHSAIPVSIHCDHLIKADSGADPDLKSALEANNEIYDFLLNASTKYGFSFWQPGLGIIHQIVLENYAFPGGMMIGTDSHTPNAGGLGMLAIGVGGADAVDAMTGTTWELMLPRLIGVKLTGRLRGWASAKDVILKIAGLLTVNGGTGSIIEYFGEGAESLSCTGKATICNMGAETGATSSLFGFDDAMARYLKATGRKAISDLAKRDKENLVADPEVYTDPEKYFDQIIEVNLDELEPVINGPFTPDISTRISKMKERIAGQNWPEDVEVSLIGSCTNSSYEDITRAALVVRNALSQKLTLKSRLMIIPGSEQVRSFAERDGYLELFRKAGGEIFANACGPCIGQWNRKDIDNNRANTIIHSFNRNFAKRTDGNPNTHVFVTSPELAVAIAFSGKLTFNPVADTIVNSEGKEVRLAEPEGRDTPFDGFTYESKRCLVNPLKNGIRDIAIPANSERLQVLVPFKEWEGHDLYDLPLLIKAKGKCTTDHISMAGPWLKYRGHLENISGNYMIGAVNFFNNRNNCVLNQLTGEYNAVPIVAKAYRDFGAGSVVIGENNFGEGSSREHAAMEPRYLGVRVVIVKSFARIHETNLKKQGVLTLTFLNGDDYNKIRENDRIDITGLKSFSSGSTIHIILNHSDTTKEIIPICHSYSDTQVNWFKSGSALNIIRKQSAGL